MWWWAIADFLVGPVGRWLALLAVIAATGAAGFMKGIEYQEGKQARVEVQTLTKRIEVVNKVAVGQEKISAAYEKGRSEREAEFKKLETEYAQNIRSVLASLPSACTWSDDVVGLLNRSRQAGRPAANPSKSVEPMPAPRSSYRWETGVGGEADVAGREGIPRLPRQAQAAD
jgi:hypothetical protein